MSPDGFQHSTFEVFLLDFNQYREQILAHNDKIEPLCCIK